MAAAQARRRGRLQNRGARWGGWEPPFERGAAVAPPAQGSSGFWPRSLAKTRQNDAPCRAMPGLHGSREPGQGYPSVRARCFDPVRRITLDEPGVAFSCPRQGSKPGTPKVLAAWVLAHAEGGAGAIPAHAARRLIATSSSQPVQTGPVHVSRARGARMVRISRREGETLTFPP